MRERHEACVGVLGVRARRHRLEVAAVAADPIESARLAGLRYVSETGPGFHRRRAGRGFVYVDAGGRRLRDAATLRRIRALVIPPAWRDVWICAAPSGHIQAVGRDARGRKQYRYHPRWRQVRDETKYTRMLAFARALPRIRARAARDLDRPGLTRDRVLATVVWLLEATLIRVGNEEYARANGSFGLTTLRGRHVAVRGADVRFAFRGKGGKEHVVGVRDRRLARIIRRLQDLPGQELFQYLGEDGARRTLDSGDVNAYLHEITGEEFTAKDFRTWAGTVLAALALAEVREFRTAREARRNIVRAIEGVAARLGNTPAICRKCYVHPEVLQAYLDGVTIDALPARTGRAIGEGRPRLTAEEGVVLGLLQQRLARAGSARAA
jgi:DNA topoisomerase I